VRSLTDAAVIAKAAEIVLQRIRRASSIDIRIFDPQIRG
jgi:hypothetical protein